MNFLITCGYIFLDFPHFVELVTGYKQYLVLSITFIHKLLNLWIKYAESLNIKGYFAMIDLFLVWMTPHDTIYYQQPVDNIVNNIFPC